MQFVDFYQYACGTWLKNTTLPPSQPILIHSITRIQERNSAALEQVFLHPSPHYPKISEFYENCMDTDSIDKQGTTSLLAFWDRIVTTSLEDFMEEVGVLHSYQIPALFSFAVVADAKNPTLNIGKAQLVV